MNLFHNILRFCEIIFSQIGLNLYGNNYDVIGNSTNWIANSLNQYTSILRASAPPHLRVSQHTTLTAT